MVLSDANNIAENEAIRVPPTSTAKIAANIIILIFNAGVLMVCLLAFVLLLSEETPLGNSVEEEIFGALVPHFAQKLQSDGYSSPHFGQNILNDPLFLHKRVDAGSRKARGL